MGNSDKPNEIRAIVGGMRSGIATLAILSAVLNVLLLGGSLYMMLIYDSVLPSESIPTLVGLLLMVLFVYLFQAAFEIFRSRILADMAAALTDRLSPSVQHAIGYMARRGVSPQGGDELAPMRDFDTIRHFLAGPGPSAFMDLPWVLFFLGVLTFLHPWLGFTALVGAILMLGITWLSSRVSAVPTAIVSDVSGRRNAMAEQVRSHAAVVHALGMADRINNRWTMLNRELVAAQDRLTDSTAVLGGGGRVFRMFLQSLVLTVGALLVIEGEASAGVIFAASILSARALAPIDTVIGQWKVFAAAQRSYVRLGATLHLISPPPQRALRLEPPRQSLVVENLVVVPPGAQQPVIQGVSFRLQAGDSLGVVGVSAAGKTTLLRALVGIWPSARGSVRLDGAYLAQWDPAELGRHLGYLPQGVELLPGTIAENIGRFEEPLDSQAVIAAARATGIHEMIVQLPNGYETLLDSEAMQLSAGQRQRVALARALYRDPFLVVLDEPNSNLDAAGEEALESALAAVRQRRGIAIVVAHRRSAVAQASHILMLRDGRVEKFGPRDEILGSFPARATSPLVAPVAAVGAQ